MKEKEFNIDDQIAILTAFKSGKEIQYRNFIADEWNDLEEKDHLFNFNECVYRVKPASVFDRVKTFEDACRELGINAREWLEENETSKMDADVLAYLKLRIITEALNEGWKPIFDGNQWHYCVWYRLMSKKEYDRNDEETRNRRGVLFGGHANYGANAGLACARADNAPSNTGANIGSRLCYKDEETAIYSGKQFADIWFDFLTK